jgi:hypothetical protein
VAGNTTSLFQGQHENPPPVPLAAVAAFSTSTTCIMSRVKTRKTRNSAVNKQSSLVKPECSNNPR